MEKIGRIFFKWRSFFPFILLPFLFLALKEKTEYYEDISFKILCLSISFAGLVIRCIVGGYAPKGTSGRESTQVAEKLNTKGLYSLIRHPLYFGNFFIFIGMVLLTKTWWFILISVILFFPYYASIIFAEERFLREKFGETFLKYYQTTPAIIPKFKNWQKPELPFSFKNVVNREFQTLFGIIVGFTFIDALSQIFVKKKIINLFWIKQFLIILILYLVLLILKNKTKLLNVEDR